MSIPLHIILNGLIALSPINSPDTFNSATAFLVDARHLPFGVPTDCFSPHRGMLIVSNVSSDECSEVGCSSEGADCVCELARNEITLNILPVPQPSPQPPHPQPLLPLPLGLPDAVDFRYVTNLSQPSLDMNLDPRFNAKIPPDALLARMRFPFDIIDACSLSSTTDVGGQSVHPMSFRPLHTLEQSADLSQAVAQQVITALSLSDGATVSLTISDFGDGNPHVLHPNPDPSRGYLITLENMRQELEVDDPCADEVGRDFAFFYELASNPPDWADRPIPHVQTNQSKSKSILEKPGVGCLYDPSSTLSSRPICPMATINP